MHVLKIVPTCLGEIFISCLSALHSCTSDNLEPDSLSKFPTSTRSTFVTSPQYTVISRDPQQIDVIVNRVLSHDVTTAILVSENNETAAMFPSLAKPVGVELFSYVNTFF